MKKALALILTASLLTGVLTACGSSEAQTDAAETTTEEAAAETVEEAAEAKVEE